MEARQAFVFGKARGCCEPILWPGLDTEAAPRIDTERYRMPPSLWL